MFDYQSGEDRPIVLLLDLPYIYSGISYTEYIVDYVCMCDKCPNGTPSANT